MKKKIILIAVLCIVASAKAQTIKVNPTGVNVNSQDPTVVYLTFGQIPPSYIAAEALWCGQLMPATLPSQGFQCRPDSIYGSLPQRYDLSQASGTLGLTDIMSIPASVTRRAYQTALNGGDAGFFYVRRFVSTTGQPDQYVNVTCRMTGGGARVPFALTNVEIKPGTNEPVLFVKANEKFENLKAEIQYNGTGRLKGRWELVRPGEESPSEFDLMTEGSLPLEDRGKQRRFLQVGRFNHFLPPAGRFSLPFETLDKLPIEAEGQYLLLLRIEAVDDKESDSDLRAIGVGNAVVHSGAVAGFPMPVLKFFVTVRSTAANWESNASSFPEDGFVLEQNKSIAFKWKVHPNASVYKLEFFDSNDTRVYGAILSATKTYYQLPPWFNSKFHGQKLKWRISALDAEANSITKTVFRYLHVD